MSALFLKKIAAASLALLLAFLLVSCAGEGREAETSALSETTTVDPTVRVTFPEGYTAVEIAARLEENEVCSAAEFLAAVSAPPEDNEFAALIENPQERAFLLEGYIFPDTYDFYKGESATRALSRFLSNMKLKYNDEFAQRAAELGYSMDDILIIASIIQTEASNPADMPNVSSVLHNRLNMPKEHYMHFLQCDATIFYLRDSIEDSTQGGVEKYSEFYNTYKRSGLPAGAICNPGIDAINAALYPAETDYFFFVTDSENNYYYAETYSEHQKNCAAVGING